MKKLFTGENLAALYFKPQKHGVHDGAFLPTLWRRIRLDKRRLYMVRYKHEHGFVIMADDEKEACVKAIPFICEHIGTHFLNDACEGKSKWSELCDECKTRFTRLAEQFNDSNILWLGWAQPDWNWVVHF